MASKRVKVPRNFENWDQFLDPNITDEKTNAEVIDEMFNSVDVPIAFSNYVKLNLIELKTVKDTDKPMFDCNF